METLIAAVRETPSAQVIEGRWQPGCKPMATG